MGDPPEHDLVLEVDGGFRINSGVGSFGYVALGPFNNVLYEECGLLPGKSSSNEAEGHAILKALEFAKDLAYPRKIEVRSDSKNWIRNLQNQNSFSKSVALNDLSGKLQELSESFDLVDWLWVPRKWLRHSHELASAAFLNERKNAAIRKIKRSDFEGMPMSHRYAEKAGWND